MSSLFPPAKKTRLGDHGHVVRCNHCGALVLNEHRMGHALDCRMKRNSKKLAAMNLSKNGQSLYAIAIARRHPSGWIPEMHYTHADNDKQASYQFWMGESDPKLVRIIKIGLAIGWFEDQQTGVITA